MELDSVEAMAVRVGSSAKCYSVWNEGFGNVKVYEMWAFSCYDFLNV